MVVLIGQVLAIDRDIPLAISRFVAKAGVQQTAFHMAVDVPKVFATAIEGRRMGIGNTPSQSTTIADRMEIGQRRVDRMLGLLLKRQACIVFAITIEVDEINLVFGRSRPSSPSDTR